MQRLAGVLLDVDGTLVDSNDAHARAWVQALSEAGVQVDFATVRRLIDKGGDKLLPEVSGIEADSAKGKAVSGRRGEIFQKEFLPALRPFPGAKELLARMKQKGLRLAVASSAKNDELQGLLRVCGADEFIEASTSSDDADRSKPDPDIVQAALGRIGEPLGQVILLGDTIVPPASAARGLLAVYVGADDRFPGSGLTPRVGPPGGHRPAAYGRHEVLSKTCRPRSGDRLLPRSRRRWCGTTAPPTAMCPNTVPRALTTAGSSSRDCNSAFGGGGAGRYRFSSLKSSGSCP